MPSSWGLHVLAHVLAPHLRTRAMRQDLACFWQASLDESKQILLCCYVGQWKCKSSGGTGSKPAAVIAAGQNTDARRAAGCCCWAKPGEQDYQGNQRLICFLAVAWHSDSVMRVCCSKALQAFAGSFHWQKLLQCLCEPNSALYTCTGHPQPTCLRFIHVASQIHAHCIK